MSTVELVLRKCQICFDLQWDERDISRWDPDGDICSDEDLEHVNTYGHFTRSLKAIHKSGTSGCNTCHLLYKAVSREVTPYNAPPDYFDAAPSVLSTTVRISFLHGLSVTWYDHSDTFRKIQLDLFTPPSEVSPWTALKAAGLVSKPGSSNCIDTIKAWMALCASVHQDCFLLQPAPLPNRLLDVQRLHPSQDVVLIETLPEQNGHYVTLSHCWGKQQPLQTSRSNYTRMKERIRWDELPRTFQDAVAITRELDIRFIWIDSLCIIQDDMADWKSEAMVMGAVYSNAWLTISAAAATDSSAGCFQQAPRQTKLEIPHSATTQAVVNVYTRKQLLHSNFGPSPEPSEGDILPLFTRGWALQERILSPRNVHFTNHEMIWECNTLQACECRHLDNLLAANPMQLESKKLYQSYFKNFQALSAFDSEHCWHALVVEYMQRDLTFPSDRLPALAGLANAFAADPRLGTYLAGMWTSHFPKSLLWTFHQISWKSLNGFGGAFDKQTPTKFTEKVSYPTWSWASRPSSGKYEYSRIAFDGASAFLTANVLSWTTAGKQDTPYTLTIEGRLAQATLAQTSSSSPLPKINTHGLYSLLGPNGQAYRCFRPDNPDSLATYNSYAHQTLSVLQIAKTFPVMGYGQETVTSRDLCLVLVPSTQYPGRLERVGTIHAFWCSTHLPRGHMEEGDEEFAASWWTGAAEDDISDWFEGAERKVVTLV